jgi:DNA-binding transcriptional MocR family regulator
VSVRYQIAGRGAAEISASVEAGIRAGALGPGAALPPVRSLATQLGVAPATVAAAYRGLRQRGLVETAGRNGTRVRHRPPVTSRLGRAVAAPPGTVDLATGAPDPALLPRLGPRLRRVAATMTETVGYATSGPRPELVALARERLVADGVPGHDASFTVTSGALDAIERLLTAHLRPGDRVAVEDPCWANLIDLLAALGLEAVGVPVDDDGPTADGLKAALGAGGAGQHGTAGVAAVVVTSRAHNPTGAAVSPARAAALRRLLAAAPDVLVIEDDHAAELAEVPLAALAGAGRAWAFVRSVSKPYGPDLRVAVVAGDETSIARVEGRMRLGAGWVSTLLQRTVVELWRDEAVAATVARARDEYARRRHGLVAALHQRGVAARGRTGINVWVPVADEPSTISALRDRGWAVAPGALYRLASEPGIRLTVGAVRPSEVEGLADAVAAAVGVAPAPGGTAR